MSKTQDNSDVNRLEYGTLQPQERDRLTILIREIIEENNGHNLLSFSIKSWEWQYADLPSGDSRVFIVKEKEKILGYYHIPVYQMKVFDGIKKVAMIQDVAISSQLRGRGVFRSLAQYAVDELQHSDIDAIYTFPNNKSIHTFLKYNNFTLVEKLPVYISPVSSSRIISKKLKLCGVEVFLGRLIDKCLSMFLMNIKKQGVIKQHHEIDQHLADIFSSYQNQHNVVLDRNRDYLNWRYVRKPNQKPYIFSLEQDGQIQAVAIFKVDELFGIPCLVLMDFAAKVSENNALLQLILEIKKSPEDYVDEEFDMMFTAGTGEFFRQLRKIGFFRIPQALNPRPLNLLTKNLKLPSDSDISNSVDWHVTLSDWDVL
jgi:N-acetylglutamate synthase-like GNAT family acetyltransferase